MPARPRRPEENRSQLDALTSDIFAPLVISDFVIIMLSEFFSGSHISSPWVTSHAILSLLGVREIHGGANGPVLTPAPWLRLVLTN